MNRFDSLTYNSEKARVKYPSLSINKYRIFQKPKSSVCQGYHDLHTITVKGKFFIHQDN